MRIVVALGGSALLASSASAEAEHGARAANLAALALRNVALQHSVVIAHGDDPQVGLRSSKCTMGSVLERALSNAMPDRDVVTLLTRVRVDEHDLAFLRPTKPVGPVYPDREQALASAPRSAVGRDGDGWRRMIASPEPLEILPLRSISTLVDAGALVICAAGRIPVVRDHLGVHGVPAVIDQDQASARLAVQLGADLLVMCTDQPKVDVAARFVTETGGRAAIGALQDAAGLVFGTAGTQVRPP